MGDHRWELFIRSMAGVSCGASAWLLVHVGRLPQKRLLAKQVVQLAFAYTMAFGFQAGFPWSWRSCNVRDHLFKFFLGVAVFTELGIAVGTCAVAWRCAQFVRRGEGLLMLPAWLIMIPLVFSGEVHYDARSGLCQVDRESIVIELVVSVIVLVVWLSCYVSAIVQACCYSPGSVASAHIRCSRDMLVVVIVCFSFYVANLFAQLESSTTSTSTADIWTFLAMIFLCSMGWLTALQCMRHRYGGRGMNVAYQDEQEVLLVSTHSLASTQSMEAFEDSVGTCFQGIDSAAAMSSTQHTSGSSQDIEQAFAPRVAAVQTSERG